jgi:hypothetical protein
MERCAVGLGPATRDRVRSYLIHLGEIAAEAADVPLARFVDRRLAELDTRRAQPGPEPLLSPFWIEELGGLTLSIRDGEPALKRTARDWANGVLTVLYDMQRHPHGGRARARAREVAGGVAVLLLVPRSDRAADLGGVGAAVAGRDLGRERIEVRRRFYRGTVAPPKSKYGRRTIRLSKATARPDPGRRGRRGFRG